MTTTNRRSRMDEEAKVEAGEATEEPTEEVEEEAPKKQILVTVELTAHVDDEVDAADCVDKLIKKLKKMKNVDKVVGAKFWRKEWE